MMSNANIPTEHDGEPIPEDVQKGLELLFRRSRPIEPTVIIPLECTAQSSDITTLLDNYGAEDTGLKFSQHSLAGAMNGFLGATFDVYQIPSEGVIIYAAAMILNKNASGEIRNVYLLGFNESSSTYQGLKSKLEELSKDRRTLRQRLGVPEED